MRLDVQMYCVHSRRAHCAMLDQQAAARRSWLIAFRSAACACHQ
jgi:hypothetical protein